MDGLAIQIDSYSPRARGFVSPKFKCSIYYMTIYLIDSLDLHAIPQKARFFLLSLSAKLGDHLTVLHQ